MDILELLWLINEIWTCLFTCHGRFVQLFSWQSVAFGKIQKQIKCKLTNLNSSRSFDDESAGSFCSNQPLIVPDLEGDLNADFRIDNSSFEETASDICDDSDNELKTATLEEITENVESFSMNGYDSTGPRIETVAGPFSPKKRNKHQASKKKIIVKGRGEKVPKLDIPGSAKRWFHAFSDLLMRLLLYLFIYYINIYSFMLILVQVKNQGEGNTNRCVQ